MEPLKDVTERAEATQSDCRNCTAQGACLQEYDLHIDQPTAPHPQPPPSRHLPRGTWQELSPPAQQHRHARGTIACGIIAAAATEHQIFTTILSPAMPAWLAYTSATIPK